MNTKLMCEIQRFYIFPKNDWEKALELIGALDHDQTFRLCFFGREEININGRKLFLLLKVTHIKFDNT